MKKEKTLSCLILGTLAAAGILGGVLSLQKNLW